MRFILLNHSRPRRPSTSTKYFGSPGAGYVRDMSKRLPYCNVDRYLRCEMTGLSMPWCAITRTDHGLVTKRPRLTWNDHVVSRPLRAVVLRRMISATAKAITNGRTDAVIDLAKANLWR